jgi:UDP-N-acetylmuramoylalanine--D-glutamate ligase
MAIINADDEELLELLYDIKSDKRYFSSTKEVGDCYLKDGVIYYKDEEVVKTKDIMLVGKHNYENIMAAIIAVKAYGVSNEAIRKVLSEFMGVAHRLERVCELNGTVYYNDSKATNIVSTHIALNSFKQPTILMLGGMERGQEFAELTPDLNYVKTCIAFGETADRIKEMMDGLMIECLTAPGLEAATHLAIEVATENDIVLLSPASASWDEFGNFEQRGNLFKQIINEQKDS